MEKKTNDKTSYKINNNIFFYDKYNNNNGKKTNNKPSYKINNNIKIYFNKILSIIGFNNLIPIKHNIPKNRFDKYIKNQIYLQKKNFYKNFFSTQEIISKKIINNN